MPKLFIAETPSNPSNRAGDFLDHILDETSEKTEQKKATQVSVKEAMSRESILKKESKRARSRVLFLTKEPSVLEEGSATEIYYKSLSEVFDEVHVIVLGMKKRKTQTLRLAPKVWVYPTFAKSFLRQPFSAWATAKKQLLFTDGFRADIIVALDPFESGITGHFLAKKFQRAFQVHITEDFFSTHFSENDTHNKWRLRFARYVLRRVTSVRVKTEILKKKLVQAYPKIADIALQPRYFNIENILKQSQGVSKSNLYPQFSFVILYVGTLTHDSTLFRAIDASRRLLQTPSIGLVVIGGGPAKTEFQERAKLLGVDAQVVFVSKVDDIVPHMLSASVLICTDTNSESDAVVIKAAASGLPIVMARNELRDDLFTDGVDSFISEPSNTQEFSQKMVKFLNTNALRTQFSENAKDVVSTRIEEDPHVYNQALRDSIESVLYTAEVSNNRTTEPQPTIKKNNTSPLAKGDIQDTDITPQLSPENPNKQTINGIEMKMPEV